MRTEDRFYFGKPGQPERFAEDAGTAIGPSMLAKIKSAIASGQTVYVSTMTNVTKVTPKTYKQWEAAGRPLFKVDSKGTLLMGSGSRYNALSSGSTLLVGITMRRESSRPGQPERFGLEDACWDGYEPVGTKQKDGRTVPNCVPKAKNEQPEEFAASGLTSAISEFLSAVPAGATRDALQKALIDYADNSAAEARMRDQGNPSDASRFGVAAGRAAQIAARSWDRLGKPAARLRDFMQGLTRMHFSRPGQPERFAAISKGSTVRYSKPQSQAEREERFRVLEINDGGARGKRVLIQSLNPMWKGRLAPTEMISLDEVMLASRPGQPERFDASSLNRGDFSDASKSPILGKLLAAKAMPDGGWRAVQAGSDTLVISFEDGDVAGDFGKRAASKGFNATSPVQAIGRYWNVEVKNGK